MFAIIGIVVVFASIIGGFLMEKGKLMVLVQPSELIIIGGAAIGTMLVANPLPVLMKIGKSVMGCLAGDPYTKVYYLESLKMLSDIFQFARKSGMAKLEEDVENPEKSATFSKYPKLLKDHHMLHFICDTLRMSVSGVVAPHDLDDLLENDIDMHHHEEMAPARALTVADALPGLGIVAAVLGVVITMGALGGPPEEIGQKVAAALVGTFLGILLSYGVVSPIAANIEKIDRRRNAVLPDAARRADGVCQRDGADRSRWNSPGALFHPNLRPTFTEMEAACKGPSAWAAAQGGLTCQRPLSRSSSSGV